MRTYFSIRSALLFNLNNSSVILGRTIKNEYLSLGVLTTTFGGAWLAMRGGKKAGATPVVGQSVQQVKESIPLNASSRCVLLLTYTLSASF